MDINKLDELIEKSKVKKGEIIGLLHDIQATYRYLPKEVLGEVSGKLDIPLSRLYSLATFFKAFGLKPQGRHLIKVCLGTACHVRGGARIVEKIERDLEIKVGDTTPDFNFTLETVNCLGACALGPIAVVDEEYYGQMNSAKISNVVKKYSKPKEE